MIRHFARLASALALSGVSVLTGCAVQATDTTERGGESVEASDSARANSLVAAARAAGLQFTWKIDTKFRRVVMTGTFAGSDGNPRRFRLYERLGSDDRGLVTFLNGRGEFIEKYDVLFTSLHEYPQGPAGANETLADLPYSFLAVDHAGQGKSTTGVVAAHIASYDTFVADLALALAPFRAMKTREKTVLFGHSMGGLIATLYAQKYPAQVSALVLSSPMFGIGVPAGVTAEQIQQLAAGFTAVGLGDRCSTALPLQLVGAIGMCLADAQCGPWLFGAPTTCNFGAATCGAIQYGWGVLQNPASIGCPQAAPADAVLGCEPYPSPNFNGNTSNQPYCEWASTHANRVGAQTFGWLNASFTAIAKASAPAEMAKLTQPTLMLTSAIDPVVPASAQITACGAIASCEQTIYAPQTDGFYFHELLDEVNRAQPISKIREFLAAQ